ncbi:unnamed protein product [Prorocentrum cordatum]|uniref:TOG domain-containing protein n=1 Tax=Prorocentrum cordatum TaxID=2364126 RepID=A0ABN9S6T4_9DINO|nr:unnamed protein product [Polarella glacialis]
MKEWPQLLPALEGLVQPGSDAGARVAALGLLRELAGVIGEGLLKRGAQATAMFQSCLSDNDAGVRSAACQLLLQMVEDVAHEGEAVQVLGQAMPGVTATIGGLAASPTHEDLLRDTLESLISAADEEPEFFKDHDLQNLWPLLVQLCSARHFADDDVRHSAMEAAMSIVTGNFEDFCKPEGQPFLEKIIALNIEWMFDVEQDVDAWTAQADAPEEDDEIDGDTVQLGEENLDRLAEKASDVEQCEDVFLPVLFKAIRVLMGAPDVTWQHSRAAVMAVSQVVEHIEDESWVDQCVHFIAERLAHVHPRVRFAAFQAVGQVAYDQEPYVQDSHHELLLAAIVTGLNDVNVRVATNAANAFVSFGEELDRDALEPHIDELMGRLFDRLKQAQTRSMQEQALAAIAMVGEIAEDLFEPYYKHVMPELKAIIARASSDDERTIRGKAFECVSLIGDAVGKDVFLPDAQEVMQTMATAMQKGFAADDTTREYVHEAAGRIATTLKREFKPYVPALLPSVFAVLAQRPKEVDVDSDDDDEKADMSLRMVGEKVLGLKTAVLDEMQESMSLIGTLIEALEDDYCEFLPITCQALSPLLDFPLSSGLREAAFKTWESLTECTRSAVEASKCDRGSLCELVRKFLEALLVQMAKCPDQGPRRGAPGRPAGGGDRDRWRDSEGWAGRAGEGGRRRAGEGAHAAAAARARGRRGRAGHLHGHAAPQGQGGGRGRGRRRGERGVGRRRRARGHAPVRALLPRGCGWRAHEDVPCGVRRGGLEALPRPHPEASSAGRSRRRAQPRALPGGGRGGVFGRGQRPLLAPLHGAGLPRRHRQEPGGAPVRLRCHRRGLPAARLRARGAGRGGAAGAADPEARRAPQAWAAREAKQVALATDSAIRAFGVLVRHQESTLGADAAQGWGLWLTNLPLRCDHEEGQKAHQQLLELVVASHPVITAPGNLPRVLGIFADVYKTKFSCKDLDAGIVEVARRANESMQGVAASLSEKQQKKLAQAAKDGGRAQ